MRVLFRVVTIVLYRPKVYYGKQESAKEAYPESSRLFRIIAILFDGGINSEPYFTGTNLFFCGERFCFTQKLKVWMMKGCRCIPLNRNEVDADGFIKVLIF
jgi:hypothetical protein